MTDESGYEHPVAPDAGSVSLDAIGILRNLSSRRLRAVADECEHIIRERAADGVFD